MINHGRDDLVGVFRGLGLPMKCALVGVFSVASTQGASAHVKWFCPYNVAGQPRGLENVLCQDFELLVGIAIFWLLGGCLIEGTTLGQSITRALNRVTSGMQIDSELIIRSVCGFFFVAGRVGKGLAHGPITERCCKIRRDTPINQSARKAKVRRSRPVK